MPGWLQSLELVGSSVFLAFVTLQWLLVAVLAFSLLAVSCVSYHLPRATWMTPKIKNLGAFAVVASVIVVLPFVAVWVGGA